MHEASPANHCTARHGKLWQSNTTRNARSLARQMLGTHGTAWLRHGTVAARHGTARHATLRHHSDCVGTARHGTEHPCSNIFSENLQCEPARSSIFAMCAHAEVSCSRSAHARGVSTVKVAWERAIHHNFLSGGHVVLPLFRFRVFLINLRL